MKEQLISFKIAKLAKAVGIKYNDGYSDSFNSILPYLEDGTRRIDFNYDGEYYAACTQSFLQKYLREVHNLHVIIQPEFYTTGINYCVQVLCYAPELEDCENHDKCTSMYGDNGEYPTYEEALEFGLELALNLIK